MNTGIAVSRDGGRCRFRALPGALWVQLALAEVQHPDASMEATPVTERDLPLPVRNEIRVLHDDLDKGAISPAEYDRLVDELLEALGAPVAVAED